MRTNWFRGPGYSNGGVGEAELKSVIATVIGFFFAAGLPAQAIFPTSPDWTSSDTQVSTGGALVDLDLDGWLDLVVANGNDMAKQHVVVYYNQGDGSFPATPDWSSTDTAYNGHLDVADVNGDGWPDVAVAVLGAGDDFEESAKLYLNNAGTLSSVPDWKSAETGNAFAVAFGDVNNDGRPDLAIGTGWSYSPPNSYQNLVYVNAGGALPAAASWVSDDLDHLFGILWLDADSDGWLDLLGVASLSNTSLYSNLGGALETTASWHTTDSNDQDAIMAVCGDLDRDGIQDLLVTDNTQVGGSGLLRQYTGIGDGAFETTYSWSRYVGYGSAVAIGDLDGDDDLDVVSGGWWENLELFRNSGAGLPSQPDWTSTQSTVVEKIILADVDRDGTATIEESFPADGRRLFQLANQPIETIQSVVVDGQTLDADSYTFSRSQGWLTVGPDPAVQTVVRYGVSKDLDMVITNWDNDVGNQLYINLAVGILFSDGFENGDTGQWSTVVS